MFNRITSVEEARQISGLIEEFEALKPLNRKKPDVRRFKPRNPRRPKHARRGD